MRLLVVRTLFSHGSKTVNSSTGISPLVVDRVLKDDMKRVMHFWEFKSYPEYLAYKKQGGKTPDDNLPKLRRAYVKGGRTFVCAFEGCEVEIHMNSNFCKEHRPSHKATEGVKEKPLNTVGLTNIRGKYECVRGCGTKVMNPKGVCHSCLPAVSKDPKYRTGVPKMSPEEKIKRLSHDY